MNQPLEAAERLLTYKGSYNFPCEGRTVSREDDIRTVAEALKEINQRHARLWAQVGKASEN